jgi:hypothetical protein
VVCDVCCDAEQHKRITDTFRFVEALVKLGKCNSEAARIREIVPVRVDDKQVLLKVPITLPPLQPSSLVRLDRVANHKLRSSGLRCVEALGQEIHPRGHQPRARLGVVEDGVGLTRLELRPMHGASVEVAGIEQRHGARLRLRAQGGLQAKIHYAARGTVSPSAARLVFSPPSAALESA